METVEDLAARAERAETRGDITGALLVLLEGQRQSDRAAFRLGMWMISSVFAAAGVVIAVILAST
ncbi:MAG: hypothetical protein OXS29_15020 [bacterium]|nr:hypothetical protein [bacterium]MDE0290263.1 hypothetical protein [bacterium]MDE0439735.1 hypothetical protein [bacterium]